MIHVVPRLPIYLDNSATTPVDPAVTAAMLPWLTEKFGNPASSHVFGREARSAIEQARSEVAALIHANTAEIIWTSGATESNNLAIKGAAAGSKDRKHLVTIATEHKAVLDTIYELERCGYEVTVLPPLANGLVDLQQFADALRNDTCIASVMLVNNEIGVIQDIAALSQICVERGVLFHVDAAQATGKIAIDVAQTPIDLMSLTAHKTYGPKGIGALYVRAGIRDRMQPQIHGGGQELGLRSGTLATHQIVGMGASFRIAGAAMATEMPQLRTWRDRFYNELVVLDGVHVNGDMDQRIAGNLNFSLALPNADQIIASITDIAVSSASACVAGGTASHVITALGGDPQLASNAIRITVGRFNNEQEIDYAVEYLRERISARS